MKYNLVVCGGTFDLLHKGHKIFINQILSLSGNAVIGVTSDSYVEKFKNQNIENFKTRRNNLAQYLNQIKATEKIEIQEIVNVYGPLLDKDFVADAIVVTKETITGAELVNKKRKELGLSKLKVELLEMEKTDDGILISSTRIRNGEINRAGRKYVKEEWKKNILELPKSLRPSLQKTMGKILINVPINSDGREIITIGDISSKNFNDNKVNQILSVIDFQVQRKKKFSEISELGFDKEIKVNKLKNPAGTLSGKLFDIVHNAICAKDRSVILIDGEEDLIVLPVILAAPLGFKIFYGQPNKGLVELIVSEEYKEAAYKLMDQFNLKAFDK